MYIITNEPITLFNPGYLMSCRAQVLPKISPMLVWSALTDIPDQLRAAGISQDVDKVVERYYLGLGDDVTQAINFCDIPELPALTPLIKRHQDGVAWLKTASVPELIKERARVFEITASRPPQYVDLDHYLIDNSHYLGECLADEARQFLNSPITHFLVHLFKGLGRYPVQTATGLELMEVKTCLPLLVVYGLYQQGIILNTIRAVDDEYTWNIRFTYKPGYYLANSNGLTRLTNMVIPPLLKIALVNEPCSVISLTRSLTMESVNYLTVSLLDQPETVSRNSSSLITLDHWERLIHEVIPVLTTLTKEYNIFRQKQCSVADFAVKLWKDLTRWPSVLTLAQFRRVLANPLLSFASKNFKMIRNQWPLQLVAEYYHPRRRFFLFTHNYVRPRTHAPAPTLLLFLRYAPEVWMHPVNLEMYHLAGWCSGMLSRSELAQRLGLIYNPVHNPFAEGLFEQWTIAEFILHTRRLSLPFDKSIICSILARLSPEDAAYTEIVEHLANCSPMMIAKALGAVHLDVDLLCGETRVFLPQCDSRNCWNAETPLDAISTKARESTLAPYQAKFIQCLELDEMGEEATTKDPRGLIVAWGTLDRYLGMTLGEIVDTFDDLYENGPYILYTPWREGIPEGFRKTFTLTDIQSLVTICEAARYPIGTQRIQRFRNKVQELESRGQFMVAYKKLADPRSLHNYAYGLFFLGMYCRRWRGPGYDYPYTHRNGNIPFQPDTVVAEWLGRLEEWGASLRILEHVPVYDLGRDHQIVLQSVGTIGRWVRKTLGLDGPPECFRTTANIFLCTGLKLCTLLSLPIPGFVAARLQSFAIVAPEEAGVSSYEETGPSSADFSSLKLPLPTIPPKHM